MFNIDDILNKNTKLLKEDVASVKDGKATAKAVSKAITNVVYAIKSYDRNYQTMPVAQRKPAYDKAISELKEAITKAENDPSFKYEKKRWQILKNTVENAENNFPEKVGSQEELDLSNFLMNTLKTLKRDNAVMSTPDFAKDLSDNDNQYKFLQQVFKSKRDDAFGDGKIIHKLENAFGNIADYREKQRQDILSGKDVEKVKANQMLSKEDKRKKYNDGVGDLGRQKLSTTQIPTMSESPVEGCTNVKKLAALWAANKVPQQGQIEIVSREGNGLGVIGKPIVYIKGKYYQVPRNDLFTNAKGGIATAASEYKGYTKNAVSDPKHEKIREALRNASVVTEGYEEFKDALARLKAEGITGKATSDGYVINYQGKQYHVNKNFVGRCPTNLLKFKDDIRTCFGGKTHGGISDRSAGGQEGGRMPQGHIDNKYVSGVAKYGKSNFNIKEEAFLEQLKKELKK